MIAEPTADSVGTSRPPTDDDLGRERALGDWLRSRGSVVIGFSGGVDSAYLACVAVDILGPDRVLAVIGRSASYPVEQWEGARKVADRFAVPVLEATTDELDDPRYTANPSNRCYFCKTELWETLVPIALERGFAAVVDGTNADDLGDHRPGARAASERGVRSPLAELGFTKAAIRRLSHARGIPTWAQPASPCLSSRIPYGTAVTTERLRQVERAERALRAVGVTGDLRVRYHGELARIELGGAAVGTWLATGARALIYEAVRAAGFARVAIDLVGFRSGSLNVLGGVTLERAANRDAAESHPRADLLGTALLAIGLPASVEARERLALVVPANTPERSSAADPATRASLVAAALASGFTHVALELLPHDADGSRVDDEVRREAGDSRAAPGEETDVSSGATVHRD